MSISHTHCIGPGPGMEQGMGMGTMDHSLLFPIVLVPFPVPVPFPFPCSVTNGSFILHGTGTETETVKQWVSVLCYVLYTLHRDRDRYMEPLSSIVPIPFPCSVTKPSVPVPVPGTASVIKPLMSITHAYLIRTQGRHLTFILTWRNVIVNVLTAVSLQPFFLQ